MNPRHLQTAAGLCFAALGVQTSSAQLATGDILIADLAGAVGDPLPEIIRVNPVTGVQDVLSSGDLLVAPTGIAVDCDGSILVGDIDFNSNDESRLIRIDPKTGQQTIISTGQLLSSPLVVSNITLSKCGTVLFAMKNRELTTGAVIEVDARTGAQRLVANLEEVGAGEDLVVDRNGTLLMTVFREDESGDIFDSVASVIAVDPVTGKHSLITSGNLLFTADAVALRKNGELLVADFLYGGLIGVNTEDGRQFQRTLFGPPYPRFARDIAMEQSGAAIVIQNFFRTNQQGTTFHSEVVRVESFSPNAAATVLSNDGALGFTAAVTVVDLCVADLNGDGAVNNVDLGVLLGSWGPCQQIPTLCGAELTKDGAVNSADLAALLGAWGVCQ